MTDLAVIILAKNEKLHIGRCLKKLVPLEPRQVFVVDCFSTDGTQEVVEQWKNGGACEWRSGVAVVEHEWPGLYAKQFNWALDNLPIRASWVLRLDADEYLYPETAEEVKGLLPKWDGENVTLGLLQSEITSLSLDRVHYFADRLIRWGGMARVPLIRFFRYGIGRCQNRAMDEHIVTSEGVDYRLKGEFVDYNLNDMDWWREKHRGYAKREAADALAGEKFKASKSFYYKCPPYLRAFAYFCCRYFIRLGFLDGYAGWMWNFWQGLWYRWLVDRTIGEMTREARRKGE